MPLLLADFIRQSLQTILRIIFDITVSLHGADKRPRLAYAIELTGEERGKIKGKEWIFPSPFSANSRQSPERPPAAVFIRTSGPGAAPLVDELNDLPDLLTALQ